MDIGPNLDGSIDDIYVTIDRFVQPATSKMARFKLVAHIKVIVIKLLNGLSKSKAIGLNEISGKFKKIASSTISLSLAHIFNYIIMGCFSYQ